MHVGEGLNLYVIYIIIIFYIYVIKLALKSLPLFATVKFLDDLIHIYLYGEEHV